MKSIKNRNMLDSFNNAINGIVAAIKSEKNMKIHLCAAILVFLMSIFLILPRQNLC